MIPQNITCAFNNLLIATQGKIFLFIHEKTLESFAHPSAPSYKFIPIHLFAATSETRNNP
jgi:hypothetical protein